MELKVELREQVGQKSIMVGGKQQIVDVHFDQYSIMVNDAEIGLVCKGKGLPINFLPVANNYPTEARNQIAAAVKVELDRLHGESDRKTYDPPSQESVAEAERMTARMAAKEDSVDDDEDENL